MGEMRKRGVEKLFTEKEIKVARMRLEGLMNKEIAQKLNVSEADISQTISRLTDKIKTVQDSVGLLVDMDVVKEGPKYTLTEKGRRLARIPTRKLPRPIELRGRFWHDFEMGVAYATSKAFGTVYCRPYTVGIKQSILVIGMTEAHINTLTEKRRKTTSSTSEPTHPIEALEDAVLIL